MARTACLPVKKAKCCQKLSPLFSGSLWQTPVIFWQGCLLWPSHLCTSPLHSRWRIAVNASKKCPRRNHKKGVAVGSLKQSKTDARPCLMLRQFTKRLYRDLGQLRLWLAEGKNSSFMAIWLFKRKPKPLPRIRNSCSCAVFYRRKVSSLDDSYPFSKSTAALHFL